MAICTEGLKILTSIKAFAHDEQNLTWIENTETYSRLVLDDVAEEDTGKYIVRITNKESLKLQTSQ